MHFLSVVLLGLANLNVVRSQAANVFTNFPPLGPPNDFEFNPSFPDLSTQTVNFTSNYTEWALYLYHVDGSSNMHRQLITSGFNQKSGQQAVSYSWNISQADNYTDAPVFFLGVGGVPVGGFNSHYFNVTKPVASTSSSSSTSSPTTSSTGSSLPTGASTTSPPTSTGSPSSATDPVSQGQTSKSKSKSGLSTGAKAGVGVACAIVGIAIIGGAITFYLRRRAGSAAAPVAAGPEKVGGEYYAPPPPPAVGSQNYPAEVTAEQRPAEVPGQRHDGWELPA